jgi:hypothetical protein
MFPEITFVLPVEDEYWAEVLVTWGVAGREFDKVFLHQGELSPQYFSSPLVPFYQAHIRALEKFFAHNDLNSRRYEHYLRMRQLLSTGVCKDVHGREVPGFPVLPPREFFFPH